MPTIDVSIGYGALHTLYWPFEPRLALNILSRDILMFGEILLLYNAIKEDLMGQMILCYRTMP